MLVACVDNVMGLDSCVEMELGSNCDAIHFTAYNRLGGAGYFDDCGSVKTRGKHLLNNRALTEPQTTVYKDLPIIVINLIFNKTTRIESACII